MLLEFGWGWGWSGWRLEYIKAKIRLSLSCWMTCTRILSTQWMYICFGWRWLRGYRTIWSFRLCPLLGIELWSLNLILNYSCLLWDSSSSIQSGQKEENIWTVIGLGLWLILHSWGESPPATLPGPPPPFIFTGSCLMHLLFWHWFYLVL